MAIYIQKIETRWTKRDRGNPGAALRAQIPEKIVVEMPEISGSIFLNEIVFSRSDYRKPYKTKVKILNENEVRTEKLSFLEEDVTLKVEFWKENVEFWNENSIKKKIGCLEFNSWCQLKTNRRYILEDTWGYYKIVYNIFYGDMLKLETVMNTKTALFVKDFQTLLK